MIQLPLLGRSPRAEGPPSLSGARGRRARPRHARDHFEQPVGMALILRCQPKRPQLMEQKLIERMMEERGSETESSQAPVWRYRATA